MSTRAWLSLPLQGYPKVFNWQRLVVGIKGGHPEILSRLLIRDAVIQ